MSNRRPDYFKKYNSACAENDRLSKKCFGLETESEKLKKDLKSCRRENKNLNELWLESENRLEKSKHENYELKQEIKKRDERIEQLESQLQQLQSYLEVPQKQISELEDRLDRETAINKRNSNTTSTPTGRDIDTPNSETKPANQYNGRTPSGRKPGGQHGHKFHSLELEDILSLLGDSNVLHKVIVYGRPEGNYNSTLEVDLVCQVIVTEHRVYENFQQVCYAPKPPRADRSVIYGANLKSLAALLSVQYNFSYEKMSSFFSILTEGKIRPCKATVYNWIKRFAAQAREEKIQFERKLLQEETVYTDSTVMVVNGQKRNNVRVCASKDGTTVYTALETKTKEEMEQETILGAFNKTLVHDHETALYAFGNAHQECLVHLLRYLKKNSEETQHSWSQEMANLLKKCLHLRKVLLHEAEIAGIEVSSFAEETIESISVEYDQILEKGNKQNELDSSWYQSEERSLLRRLEKYKDEHLYFLSHFQTDPDNNLSERKLRTCKLKQKNSGGFRSFAGLCDYTDILTLINNHINDSNILNNLRNMIKTRPRS